MATEAARLDLEGRDLAQELQGGEMGRKEMRWEEGEAGGSGMGRRLRAPGERLLPSQHPTCPQGLGSPTKERRLSQATEWPQCGPCPALHLPLLLGQSLGAAGGTETLLCPMPGKRLAIQIPYLDPGSFQACSEGSEGSRLVWGGERRRQCHLLRQASPGHPF